MHLAKEGFAQVAQVHISLDGSLFKGMQQELINSIRIFFIMYSDIRSNITYVSGVTSGSACNFIKSTIYVFV